MDVRKKTSQELPDYRGHTGDAAIYTKSLYPFFGNGKQLRDKGQSLRNHKSPANSLNKPGHVELCCCLRKTTDTRCNRENSDPDQKNLFLSVILASLSSGDQKSSISDDVHHNDKLHISI
ncbi:hypothetical protein D3C71_1451770 [compost metagenome]